MQSRDIRVRIPQFKAHCHARLHAMVSSVTTDLCAVNKPLKCIASQDPQKIVILTGSRVTLQRLPRAGFILAPNTRRSLVMYMEHKEFRVALQGVPSHVGLPGKRRADFPALQAHHLIPSLHAADDIQCRWRARREHFATPALYGQA